MGLVREYTIDQSSCVVLYLFIAILMQHPTMHV